jgi:hypothetical protein
VSDLVAAIKERRREFAALQAVFGEYADEFDADVDQFHGDVAERREVFAATLNEFSEYRREFHDVEVRALLDAVEEFRREIDDVRAEFETTENAFAAFAREFYGGEAAGTGSTRETEADAEPGNAEADAGTPGDEEAVELEVGEPEHGSTEPEVEQPDAGAGESEGAGEAEAAEKEPQTDREEAEGTREDMVRCRVCGEYYQAITEPHLQTHDMSIQEYREEYGDGVPLRPDDQS